MARVKGIGAGMAVASWDMANIPEPHSFGSACWPSRQVAGQPERQARESWRQSLTLLRLRAEKNKPRMARIEVGLANDW